MPQPRWRSNRLPSPWITARATSGWTSARPSRWSPQIPRRTTDQSRAVYRRRPPRLRSPRAAPLGDGIRHGVGLFRRLRLHRNLRLPLRHLISLSQSGGGHFAPPGQPHRPRARGPEGDRWGIHQRRDRKASLCERRDGENARRPPARQAGAQRPSPGRDPGLRSGPGGLATQRLEQAPGSCRRRQAGSPADPSRPGKALSVS